jgi:hypothetical protein
MRRSLRIDSSEISRSAELDFLTFEDEADRLPETTVRN